VSPGAALITVAIAAPVLLWLGRAIFRPMAPCRWCRGRFRAGDRSRWRNLKCSHCVETPGERMTLGARIVRGQGRRWGK
jgi:hypothetical protein